MSKKNFGIGAKGIVLIAVLAAAAIGIAGYLFSRNSVQEVTMQEPMIDNMAVSTQEPLSVTESATIPTASSLPQVCPGHHAPAIRTPDHGHGGPRQKNLYNHVSRQR